MEQGAEVADLLAVEIDLEERLFFIGINMEMAGVDGKLRFGILCEIKDRLLEGGRTFRHVQILVIERMLRERLVIFRRGDGSEAGFFGMMLDVREEFHKSFVWFAF